MIDFDEIEKRLSLALENETKESLTFWLEKMEMLMPEVHEQVKIYEERKKAGTLKPTPSNTPFF